MAILALRGPSGSYLTTRSSSVVFRGPRVQVVKVVVQETQRRRGVALNSLPESKSSASSASVSSIPLLASILKPMRDFGIGKTSMIQGSVGLFVFAGIGFAFMLVSWARGGQLGRRGQGYQAILEFPEACGISVGTPVRIRGVPVGGVLSVQPSLEKVRGVSWCVTAVVCRWFARDSFFGRFSVVFGRFSVVFGRWVSHKHVHV